jgi:transposase
VTSIAQMTLANDRGGGDVEPDKQRRRAVAAVIARTALLRAERHRQAQFLGTIEAQVPAGLDVHVILDNDATDKTPRVRRGFARHPLFHLHFTPTPASWLNLVERWFALLSQRSRAEFVLKSHSDNRRDSHLNTSGYKEACDAVKANR